MNLKAKKSWVKPNIVILNTKFTTGGKIYTPTESNGFGGPHGNHSS